MPGSPVPDFPFDQLWTQLRRKTWMWLFKRHQIEASMRLVRGCAEIRGVTLAGPAELEIAGAVGRNEMTHDEPRVRLRLTEKGDLHITTSCTCFSGSLCEHAATLLLRISEPPVQAMVRLMAEPGLGSLPAGGSAGDGAAVRIEHELRASQEHIRPFLHLRRLTIEHPTGRVIRGQPVFAKTSLGAAAVSIEYEGCPQRLIVPARGPAVRWTDAGGQAWKMTRHLQAERLLLADVTQSGLMALSHAMPEARADEPLGTLLAMPEKKQALFWASFLRDHVPELRAAGWHVEVAADFGFSIHDADEDAWFTELDSGQSDSYSLDLGIEVDGRRVSVIPLLVECIENGLTVEELEKNLDQKYLMALPGPGNPVLSVPAARLLVLVRFLDELLATRPASKDGRLHLDKLRAAQLASLQGLPIQMPAELARLRERLAGFTGMAFVEPPASLRATLRPYQHEGLSWLQFLREFSLHGILADDMGLGKTLQTISHLLTEKEAGRMDRPSLILAPTSVLRNWAREITKFAPGLRVLLLHGGERRGEFYLISRHDVVITSYPLLVRDAESLLPIQWHLAVLDEAQHIKNPKSKAALTCRLLQARHRLCLSGTPMENHLGELWSLFEFLMPGLLGDADTFREHYRNPIERGQDSERQQQLSARLQPLLLRRTKDAVAKDLPPKTEILHTIELEKTQADLYETIRAAVDKRVKEAISAQGLDRSQIIVLDALLKLRQVCCHPRLLKTETAQQAAHSAKTAYLMEEMLPELLEEGSSILIFSQFTEMLGILEKELKNAGIRYVKLTGSTKDRETPVNQFQSGEARVFLISLKAGGAGLNLTTADTVIHYDPWWNPAAEAQASDRAHRIGQTRPVFIHKLICQDTIEERILEMQKSKAALVESLLTGRAEKLRLTQDDLQRLLEA